MSGKQQLTASVEGLPEQSLMIIKKGQSVEVISLDSYDISNAERLITEAVQKYGNNNVRYARIVDMEVKLSVKISG